MYEWLLYGHLVGVGLLVVGMGIHVASVEGLRRGGTVAQLCQLVALGHVGLRLLIAGAVTLLGFGLLLAVRYWALTDGWIVAALGLIVFQGVLGAVVSEPGMKTLSDALAESPDPAEVLRAGPAWSLCAAGRASIVTLLELELLMTLKPEGELLLWSLVVTVLVAAALAATSWRWPRPTSVPRQKGARVPGR